MNVIKLAQEAGMRWEGGFTRVIECATEAELTRFAALVRAAALDEAIKIIEEYRIPVGNSAAGEIACEWTRSALEEIRDMLRAMKEQT